MAAPLYQFWFLKFSFLFLPWFASLALRFAVSFSPPFLPAGPWKGGRCFQEHKGGGWREAEWKSRLWVVVVVVFPVDLWQRFEDTQEKGGGVSLGGK